MEKIRIVFPRHLNKSDKFLYDLTVPQFIALVITFLIVYATVKVQILPFVKYFFVISELVVATVLIYGNIEGIPFVIFLLLFLQYYKAPKIFVYTNEDKYGWLFGERKK
ncbi:MAG: hypothetical protein QW134_04310 [Nitrososphaeria archaeon]